MIFTKAYSFTAGVSFAAWIVAVVEKDIFEVGLFAFFTICFAYLGFRRGEK